MLKSIYFQDIGGSIGYGASSSASVPDKTTPPYRGLVHITQQKYRRAGLKKQQWSCCSCVSPISHWFCGRSQSILLGLKLTLARKHDYKPLFESQESSCCLGGGNVEVVVSFNSNAVAKKGDAVECFCKGGTDPLLLALPRLSRPSTPGLACHTCRSLSQLGAAAATAHSWMSVASRCHASLEHPSSFAALSSIRRCQTIDDPHIRHILTLLALVQLSISFCSFPCQGLVAHWPESPLAYRIALYSFPAGWVIIEQIYTFPTFVFSLVCPLTIQFLSVLCF
jgi:hypothetical protein